MYDVRTRQFGKWLLKSATASGQFSFQHGYTFPFLERGRVAVSVLLKRKRQYYKTSQSPLWQNEKNPFVCCTLHTLHTVSRLTLPGSYSQHSRFGQAAAAHRFTHTDLRLISSRSRVLERHVNVSLSRLFDSANRISLFQTSRVPPPRTALISAAVERPPNETESVVSANHAHLYEMHVRAPSWDRRGSETTYAKNYAQHSHRFRLL